MAAGAVELEVRTSRSEALSLGGGGWFPVVRVQYRPAGTRIWRHFNLVPKDGQTLEQLEKHANVAAQMVHAGAALDVDGASAWSSELELAGGDEAA